MPELIEVERYRRLAERVVGRSIVAVEAPDRWYLKGGTSAEELTSVMVGEAVTHANRLGKLLMCPVSSGHVVGLRFGMTGRLVVDGDAAIERLEYASGRDEPDWDRFAVVFTDGGRLRVNDPRRLGGVELDPDIERLGPDAASIDTGSLATAFGTSRASLKACLLDQRRIAGLGNLLCDEILWRAGLDPARPAESLDAGEHARLAVAIVATVAELTSRGGSHKGDLHHARERGASCPLDGAPLARRTIGGRTTYSCSRHQR